MFCLISDSNDQSLSRERFTPGHPSSCWTMSSLLVSDIAFAVWDLNLILLAVDAHTAHHLYYECLKGDLMRGRTVILVSHHVQLTAPGAAYVVSLENGLLQYAGE